MPENVFENGWVNTNTDRTKWLRLDPDVGGIYRYNSETGNYDIPLPIVMSAITGLVEALVDKSDSDHSHPAHGDIDFTGTVSAGGDAGLTGERTVGGYKLTFKKGLLVGFQAV